MNPEWLPGWWVESAVCKWLAGPGRMLTPTLVHVAVLALEVAVLRAYGKLPHAQRRRAERSAWVLFMIHAFLWVITLSAIDGGLSYRASAFVWGLVVCVLAVRAQRRVVRVPDQPDPYSRRNHPDFARLRGDQVPERTA